MVVEWLRSSRSGSSLILTGDCVLFICSVKLELIKGSTHAESEVSLKERFLLFRSTRRSSSFNGVELNRRGGKPGEVGRELDCMGGKAFPLVEMLLIDDALNA